MPMGFAAGMEALKVLGVPRERNMDTVCVVFVGNGHAAGCFVDGLQFATGCTFGKGILKKEPKGKWSFQLIHKKTGKAVRGSLKARILAQAFAAPFITEYRIKGVNPTDIPAEVAKPGFKRPFSLDPSDLVEIEGPFDVVIPKPKPCFVTVSCTRCDATIAENYAFLEDGQPVCMDCTSYIR